MVTRRGQLGLASLLALLGCSPTPPNPDEAGVTTDPGGSSEDSNGGPKLDIPPIEDGDGEKWDILPSGDLPHCWTTYYMNQAEANDAHPDCVFEPFGPDVEFVEMCVDRPLDGDCADICPAGELCEGMGYPACFWTDWEQLCGPYETANSCCLLLAVVSVVSPTE